MSPGGESCELSHLREKSIVPDCNTLAYRTGNTNKKTETKLSQLVSKFIEVSFFESESNLK